MADPFLGEIRLFFGTFAPKGWAFCKGYLMPINQSTALFSLLGTYYGGDGRTTFALPNLSARILVGTNKEKGTSVGEKEEYGASSLVREQLGGGPRYIIAMQGIFPPRGDDGAFTYSESVRIESSRVPQRKEARVEVAEFTNRSLIPKRRRKLASKARPSSPVPQYLLPSRVVAKRPSKRAIPVSVSKEKAANRSTRKKPSPQDISLKKVLAKGPTRLAEKLLGIRREMCRDRKMMAMILGLDLHLRPENIQQYEWALAIPEFAVIERYAKIGHVNPKNLIDDTMEWVPAGQSRVKYFPFEAIKQRAWKSPFPGFEYSDLINLVGPSRALTHLTQGLNELVGELNSRKRLVGQPLLRKLSNYQRKVEMICGMSGDKALYDHIIPIITPVTSNMRADKVLAPLKELSQDLKELPTKRIAAASVAKTRPADAKRVVKAPLTLKPNRMAEKLLGIRLSLGLSQGEMLKQLGVAQLVSPADISKYERGTRAPALGILLSYARLSNVELEVLVDDELDLPEALPSPNRHGGIKRKSTQRKRKR